MRLLAAPGLPKVRTIKELIHQMLYNLVLNAADAMSGAGDIVLEEMRTRRRIFHPVAGRALCKSGRKIPVRRAGRSAHLRAVLTTAPFTRRGTLGPRR
jgi:nitrogen-specific signal transduction histidine kinase